MRWNLSETLLIYTNDLMSFFIVPMLFILFREAEMRCKGKNNAMKRTAKQWGHAIGVNTLQIYVLQYFAIDIVERMAHDVLRVDVSSYELVLSPVLAIGLCGVCVFVSEALHKTRLGFIFGR